MFIIDCSPFVWFVEGQKDRFDQCEKLRLPFCQKGIVWFLVIELANPIGFGVCVCVNRNKLRIVECQYWFSGAVFLRVSRANRYKEVLFPLRKLICGFMQIRLMHNDLQNSQ